MRRLACIVPFCRRTRGDRKNDPLPQDFSGLEWICAKHWRAVPSLQRRIKRRAERAATQAQAAYDAAAIAMAQSEKPRPSHVVEAWRFAADARRRAVQRSSRLWCRCKRLAIEAAAGIA